MTPKRLLARAGALMLLFVVVAQSVFAQGKTVTGKVTDSKDGSPVPNASITIKGTSKGTTTDQAGNFRIAVDDNNAILVISSVGFGTTEVAVGDQSVLAVTLVSSQSTLNEVIVVGYGTQRKRDLTGSVVAVSAKDFNKGALTTPEQLISGKVAGVSITPNNGAPGSGSTIRIRGGASLNASNDPLIVIDGMPISNSDISGLANQLALINPNDIATMTILKDASATAIYGSRASNGVIMITTKKGQKGKAKFSFSTQFSIGKLIKQFPVLSAAEFRNLVQTYGSASQIALMGKESTNWQDQIYQTAIGSDNNLSISGSLKKIPYRLSLGYLNQSGILRTGNLQRGSVGLNLSPVVWDDHLKIDVNIKTSFTKSRFANEGSVGGAATFDPTQAIYSGSKRYGGYWERLDPSNTNTGLASLSPKNPLGLLEQKYDVGYANRIIANAVLDYKFHYLPDLHAIANVGYDFSRGFGNNIINDSAASDYRKFTSGDKSVHGGLWTKYRRDISNSYANFYFNYTKNITPKNRIEAMAGIEYQDYLTTNYNFKEYAYDSAVTKYPQYPFDKPQNRILSYLARVNYTFNNMVFITASIRRDGSSKFSPENRWGNFPSAAIGWKINDLPFLKNSRVVSNLKLRLGYGVTGQQDGIGNYDYISYYGLSDIRAQYQFGNSYYQMYRPGAYYANRKWEQTATSNIGVDYGFIDNRISGSVEVYLKQTTDLLNQITQPAFTNFSNTVVANVGSMENRGVEFSINLQPIQKRDISWEIAFNATYNENKITRLDLNDNPNYISQVAGIGGNGGVQANAVGHPRSSFYMFKQIYDKESGKPIEDLFVDFNRDGSLNTSDLYIFKSPDPKWFFGFSTNVNYKKWSAGLNMRANLGNYLYNQAATNGAINKFLFSSYLANQSADVLNTYFRGIGDFYQSDYYIQNASFLRMDNVNIGYNVGKLKQSNINMRLNAGVQNVFIITKYKGIDPEISNGIDNNQYPRPRTFIVGVGLDF